ncbi:emerin (Emery-Dreifuss muscular dystrophy) [Mugil cephalus]|uniref:emerin (Emery-Dreifuss muscular dystrophy) n=1 Tax=Mugil cephalus TaxID=48193 RepID=UPI001FB7DB55|nr:emerin (Emery-Dreifuss muscular dystrophy) [Mugil cephalus]
MSLSDKSDAEITSMLAEYGIKHGPIVDSTRKLYEKKLEKAMKSTSVKTSPDKTFYREEEEVTYITYRSPAKQGSLADNLKQRGTSEHYENEQVEFQEGSTFTSKTTNYRAVRSSNSRVSGKSGSCKLIGALLLLGVLAGVVYYAYDYVMNNGENPFRA